MSNLNKIVISIIVILTILGTFKVTSMYYNRQNEADKIALKKELIKNSELEKLREGLYTKLVADTLTIKELKKVNDSLELELENPETITVVKWKYKSSEKPIDSVKVEDSLISIVDYYPNQKNKFITYTGLVDKNSETGLGTFSFEPQEIRLGIGQNKDGTYSVNSGVPEYLEVTGIDVQSLPREPIKTDNFGWIVGSRIGKDYNDFSYYLKVNGGIRYKKIYLSVGAATNKTVEGGLDIEF